jgi:ubiquinone/menaquinone biosynthesis C-methylase UbiE
MLFAPAQRSDQTEILDNPDCNLQDLKDNLEDIAKFNSFLRTRNAILKYIKAIIAIKGLTGKVKILDLCCGSADIPVFITDWARKAKKDIEILAVDISKDIISVACQEITEYPEIKAETGDAFNLSYGENSFQIVICSQAFHHFSNEDCIRLLKVMYGLCSDGIVINDLRRAWVNYYGAVFLSRAWNLNYMSRNDAPISVLRAFTKEEFSELGKAAGIPGIKCYSYFTHSLQLVAIKQ